MPGRGFGVATLVAAAALIAPGAASAAPLEVTSTADTGAGSLRAVIAASSSGDVIHLPASSQAYLVTSGQIVLPHDLTIRGDGAASTTIDVTGGGSRIFEASSGSYTISGLTLKDGNAGLGAAGGAIYAHTAGGSLDLADDVFDSNQSNGGGALELANGEKGAVARTTFSNNNAGDGSGGGIDVSGQSTHVDISASTFTKNTAIFGGAIELSQGTTYTLTNSTISANTASAAGGGVDSDGASGQFTNDTIASNIVTGEGVPLLGQRGAPVGRQVVGTGGGVATGPGSPATNLFRNTIIAKNTPSDCDPPASAANRASNPGNNLDGDSSCFTGSHDIHGDPQLGALADNGGPTQTRAITTSSIAFNTAENSICPATDQRGITRPQGPTCDIGAFEVVVPAAKPPAPLTSPPTVTPASPNACLSAKRPHVTIHANGRRFLVGQFAAVRITASSKVGLRRDPSVRRRRLSTRRTGRHSLRAVAVDRCGRSTTAIFAYRVLAAQRVKPRFTG